MLLGARTASPAAAATHLLAMPAAKVSKVEAPGPASSAAGGPLRTPGPPRPAGPPRPLSPGPRRLLPRPVWPPALPVSRGSTSEMSACRAEGLMCKAGSQLLAPSCWQEGTSKEQDAMQILVCQVTSGGQFFGRPPACLQARMHGNRQVRTCSALSRAALMPHAGASAPGSRLSSDTKPREEDRAGPPRSERGASGGSGFPAGMTGSGWCSKFLPGLARLSKPVLAGSFY